MWASLAPSAAMISAPGSVALSCRRAPVRKVQPPAEALRAVGRAQLRAEVHAGRERRDEMVGVRRGLREERLVLARGAGGVAHADRPDRDVDVVERDALVRAVAHFERDDRSERREAAAALPQTQVHRGGRAVRRRACASAAGSPPRRPPGPDARCAPRGHRATPRRARRTAGPTPCSRGGRARGSASARARSPRWRERSVYASRDARRRSRAPGRARRAAAAARCSRACSRAARIAGSVSGFGGTRVSAAGAPSPPPGGVARAGEANAPEIRGTTTNHRHGVPRIAGNQLVAGGS